MKRLISFENEYQALGGGDREALNVSDDERAHLKREYISADQFRSECVVLATRNVNSEAVGNVWSLDRGAMHRSQLMISRRGTIGRLVDR